jgi:hypothetical protein
MELSPPQLQMVIQAVFAFAESTQAEIGRSKEDVTSLEDFLVQIGNLEAELKAEYLKLRAKNPSLLPYEILVGARKFRKL